MALGKSRDPDWPTLEDDDGGKSPINGDCIISLSVEAFLSIVSRSVWVTASLEVTKFSTLVDISLWFGLTVCVPRGKAKISGGISAKV